MFCFCLEWSRWVTQAAQILARKFWQFWFWIVTKLWQIKFGENRPQPPKFSLFIAFLLTDILEISNFSQLFSNFFFTNFNNKTYFSAPNIRSKREITLKGYFSSSSLKHKCHHNDHILAKVQVSSSRNKNVAFKKKKLNCDQSVTKMAWNWLKWVCHNFFSDKGLKLWPIVTKKGLSQFPQKIVPGSFKLWPIWAFCHKLWQSEQPERNLGT